MEAVGEEEDAQADASAFHAGAKVMARVDEVVICKACGSALESTPNGGFRYSVEENSTLVARCLCNSETMQHVEVECRARLPVTSNCVYRARKVNPSATVKLTPREVVADATLACVEIACASPDDTCKGTRAVQSADGFNLEFTCTECLYTWKQR